MVLTENQSGYIMIRAFIGIVLFAMCCFAPLIAIPCRAMVSVPVTDAIGSGPLVVANSSESKKRYQSLPYSWKQTPDYLNARSHQLLFNQVVTIVREKGGEVCVEIPDVYYKTSLKSQAMPLKGWVMKSDIIEFSTLRSRNVDVSKIPHNYTGGAKQKTIVLTMPCRVSCHVRTYSAGTRFSVKDEQKDYFVAYVFNTESNVYDTIKFSKKVCMLNSPRTRQQKVDVFIDLLKSWSHRKEGFIPYVLGGGSWLRTYVKDSIVKHPLRDYDGQLVKGKGNGYYSYDREGGDGSIKSGFDCSSLIYTAAHVSGIPYYCKNTTTLVNQLRKLGDGDRLEVGDLICFPGHVMIVSGVGKRLQIIQSEGYSERMKEGKVYESDAQKLFYNICADSDLVSSYRKKESLICLNADGKTETPIVNWSIYKLKSCWDIKSS